MKGTLAQRFWAKVDKSSGEQGCWVWTAATIKGKGYGKISVATGIWHLAHIVSWRMANGAVPSGLCVLHRCDNPPCVNPAHLFLGTLAENNADMKNKNRHQHGERQWMAKLTENDVREIRTIYRPGYPSLSCLGRKYGVSPSTIWQVTSRKKWKHVK